MTGELFFNGREWRNLGLSEQQVRLIELLVNRTGGAQEPDLNLTEVNNITQKIESESSNFKHDLQTLKRKVESLDTQVVYSTRKETPDQDTTYTARIADLERKIQRDQDYYHREIHRLSQRINQLENEQ